MSAARSVRDGRHRARIAALQLLYLRDVGGGGADEVDAAIERFWAENSASPERRRLAMSLFDGTSAALDRIDPLITEAAANWRLERMAVVDRLVLRMGTYELLEGSAPTAVVIDEAIELAKAFSGDDSAPFVNGVLDGVRRLLESAEPPRPPGTEEPLPR